jgi:hypothetical protein
MLYYLYLKKKSSKQSEYYTLSRMHYDGEVRPGMTITYNSFESSRKHIRNYDP